MPKKKSIARAITLFSSYELRTLIRQAKKVAQFPADTQSPLDIRLVRTKDPFSRILIIVSKKCGSAPKRNLFKRRLKALFYEKKYYNQPYNVVIYCKKGGTELTFEQLANYLEAAYVAKKAIEPKL